MQRHAKKVWFFVSVETSTNDLIGSKIHLLEEVVSKNSDYLF